MRGQLRDLDEILKRRMETIQALAEANTEQLRLNQKASGLMVLDMKDARDGIENRAHEIVQARNDAALEKITKKINRLEAKLSCMDKELAAAMKEQG